MKPPCSGFQERGGDAAFVEDGQQTGLFRRPLVGVAAALGDQAGDRAAGDRAGRLDEHGQVVAVGKAPHDLADIISGQGLEGGRRFDVGGRRHITSFSVEQLSIEHRLLSPVLFESAVGEADKLLGNSGPGRKRKRAERRASAERGSPKSEGRGPKVLADGHQVRSSKSEVLAGACLRSALADPC